MSVPPTTTTSSAQPIIDRILGRTADGRSPGAAMRHIHQSPSGHANPRASAREHDRGLHGDDLAAGPPRSGSTRAGDPIASLAGLFDDEHAAVEENLGCFGWLRGVRERAVMLELRKKSGEVLAVGYSWVESIAYDPARGITIHLPSRQITIKGRNLNSPAPQADVSALVHDSPPLSPGDAHEPRAAEPPELSATTTAPGTILAPPGVASRILQPGLLTPARLFDGLTRHRVPWLREMDHAESLIAAVSGEAVIESISWDHTT